jgi:hypothetical protein
MSCCGDALSPSFWAAPFWRRSSSDRASPLKESADIIVPHLRGANDPETEFETNR